MTCVMTNLTDLRTLVEDHYASVEDREITSSLPKASGLAHVVSTMWAGGWLSNGQMGRFMVDMISRPSTLA